MYSSHVKNPFYHKAKFFPQTYYYVEEPLKSYYRQFQRDAYFVMLKIDLRISLK